MNSEAVFLQHDEFLNLCKDSKVFLLWVHPATGGTSLGISR